MIVSRTRVGTALCALVLVRLRDFISLSIQQGIQRFLYRPHYHLIKLFLDFCRVQVYNLSHGSPSCVFFLAILFYTPGLPFSIVRKILYLIHML